MTIKLHKESAFTLVELLVSVALIGALSTLAIENMSNFKQRAYDATALQTQANLITAVEGWINTDWNQSDIGSSTWIHQADNSNTYRGSFGNELDAFFSNNINDELAWFVNVDTTCISGGSCNLDRLYRANIGHCRSTESSSNFMSYHVHEARKNSTYKENSITLKNFRNC